MELDALRILLYLNLEDPPTLRSWLYNSPIVSKFPFSGVILYMYIYMYIYVYICIYIYIYI